MIRPLRMVALDLSTAATGIASTNDPDGVPFPHTYTVPGTAGRPLHEQIALIKRSVRRSCGWRPGHGAVWVPDLVVIEGTFSRNNAHASDYPLHALHACVKQALWDRKIPYVDVSNGTVKMWATGTGATSGPNKVTKDKVVAAVIANYGKTITINPADDNQCDAVALLTLGMEKYGQPIGPYVSDKPRRRAFKNIAWPALGTEAP